MSLVYIYIYIYIYQEPNYKKKDILGEGPWLLVFLYIGTQLGHIDEGTTTSLQPLLSVSYLFITLLWESLV